jgi:hypothetical protein
VAELSKYYSFRITYAKISVPNYTIDLFNYFYIYYLQSIMQTEFISTTTICLSLVAISLPPASETPINFWLAVSLNNQLLVATPTQLTLRLLLRAHSLTIDVEFIRGW